MSEHLPHPTDEAVELAAEKLWHLRIGTGAAPYAGLSPLTKHTLREQVLPLLTAAHAQTVTDVLAWEEFIQQEQAARGAQS